MGIGISPPLPPPPRHRACGSKQARCRLTVPTGKAVQGSRRAAHIASAQQCKSAPETSLASGRERHPRVSYSVVAKRPASRARGRETDATGLGWAGGWGWAPQPSWRGERGTADCHRSSAGRRGTRHAGLRVLYSGPHWGFSTTSGQECAKLEHFLRESNLNPNLIPPALIQRAPRPRLYDS
jgi:hypothetical protein